MTDEEKVLSGLIDIIETLYESDIIQQLLLDKHVPGWVEQADRLHILQGPMIRRATDALRAGILGDSEGNRPPETWQAIANRLIESGGQRSKRGW